MIDLALLTDESDLRRLMEGVRQARRLLSASAFDAVADQQHRRGNGLSDGELKDEIYANVRSYHHPTKTCAMGPDPAQAVVDHNGHVHGTDGLVVADASIMPEIPSANTNLPTIMLAEQIAARLAG